MFFCIALALTLTPWVSAGLALLLGLGCALAFGNPWLQITRSITHRMLAIAVMGLGAGMDLGVVIRVGAHGVGYTLIGISLTMTLGWLLGLWLKAKRDTALLITVGTAICGGSAIAAVAPVIRANSEEVSVSLATVFLLNACAIFIFPWLGHHQGLSEYQFGLWSALAIHDTSSVVGAAMQFGNRALEIATTVKLARALWIIPVTLAVAYFWREKSQTASVQKVRRPWFILGFVLLAALVTWVPEAKTAGHWIAFAAKRLMVVTLFVIGSNLNREAIRSMGLRPFLLGVLLWFLVGTSTLVAILTGWIA